MRISYEELESVLGGFMVDIDLYSAFDSEDNSLGEVLEKYFLEKGLQEKDFSIIEENDYSSVCWLDEDGLNHTVFNIEE